MYWARDLFPRRRVIRLSLLQDYLKDRLSHGVNIPSWLDSFDARKRDSFDDNYCIRLNLFWWRGDAEQNDANTARLIFFHLGACIGDPVSPSWIFYWLFWYRRRSASVLYTVHSTLYSTAPCYHPERSPKSSVHVTAQAQWSRRN